jgi:hypothetical protein
MRLTNHNHTAWIAARTSVVIHTDAIVNAPLDAGSICELLIVTADPFVEPGAHAVPQHLSATAVCGLKMKQQ